MTRLDALYCRLLHLGFIILGKAIYAQDFAWMNAECKLLHNMPSLIGEANFERHKYFWECERVMYIEWMNASGTDVQKDLMRMYYEPIWKEMEAITPQKGEDTAKTD